MMEALLNHFVVSDTNPIYSPYMAVGAKFTAFCIATDLQCVAGDDRRRRRRGLSPVRPTIGRKPTLCSTKGR